jgi:hypothetical protein
MNVLKKAWRAFTFADVTDEMKERAERMKQHKADMAELDKREAAVAKREAEQRAKYRF